MCYSDFGVGQWTANLTEDGHPKTFVALSSYARWINCRCCIRNIVVSEQRAGQMEIDYHHLPSSKDYVLKQDDLIKSQLVLTAWRFSQKYGAGHVGAQLIMCTLANRVRAGWGPWLHVIETVSEHMADASIPELKYPSVWEGAFVKLLNAVDGIFDGSAEDMSKGALYWGDLRYIENARFKERIIGEPDVHRRVADFNSLSFWT